MLKIAPINELVKIKTLPEGITKLQKLELFYLSGTDIKELPNGFGNLGNLQELYLLSRSIVKIPSLYNLKKLRVLECQANINQIPDQFTNLTELEELKLHNNAITGIPNVSKLQKLRKLEIKNTLLGDLPIGITTLRNLKQLFIYQNPIRKLPKDFSQLSKLEIIDASQTNITNLPERFTFPKLKKLNVERTFITSLPEEIFLPKLEELRISCFTPSISKFLSIKQLYIVNTLPGQELTTFPEELFKLHNLSSLDIGKGTYDTIPDKFDEIPKLRILYIHNTNIKSIDGIPGYLQNKMLNRNIIIYVNPEFNFNGIKDIVNLRIKF